MSQIPKILPPHIGSANEHSVLTQNLHPDLHRDLHQELAALRVVLTLLSVALALLLWPTLSHSETSTATPSTSAPGASLSAVDIDFYI